MPTDDLRLPETLRAAVAADLRPVAPLASPLRRAGPLVPIAIMLLFAAMLIFGLRRDAPRLGFLLTWGASTAEMMLGLLLAAAALREAVPGTTIPRRVVGVLAGTTVIAVLTITWLTWMASPTFVAPGHVGYVWAICLAGTVAGALPALAVSGWLAARAFPLRPRIAGALYGLGAGLMSDAGWRLFCHFSVPAHVVSAHTLGIAVATLLGVGLAVLLGRPRR
jgi:hypothetical protein